MRKLYSLSWYLPKAAAVALAGGMALLSGCGLGTTATDVTPEAVSGIQIDGTAFGGSTAISGATVTLYVSGNSGYGSTPTYSATASAKTAASTGAFSFSPAFSTSSCTSPASQIVYLAVSGGDPTGKDATGATNNHAILMASVLGVCSTLTNASALHVAINEATTVAAAYALSGFTTVTSSAGGLASLSIGAPSTNSQGLLDAAANALLMVTSSSTTAGAAGNANASSANVELPTAALNTLANAITPCVNALEYTSYPCADQGTAPTAGLFTLATPPSGTKPTNVYQALLNIARYPGQNVPAILSLPAPGSPFQPSLPVTTVSSSTAPNDLSLGIAYPNSTLASASTGPAALAIDGSDNVWVLGASNGTSNYVTELSSPSAGAAYTNNLPSSLASSQNVRWGAFDTTGNLWLSDGAALAVYNGGTTTPTAQSFSTLTPGGVATGLDANNYVLAIDASNNVFTATYGAQGNCVPNTVSAATTVCNIVELPGGSASSATNLFGGNYIAAPSIRGMFADAGTSAGKGNLWFTDYGVTSATKGATTTPGNTVQVLTPSTGALLNGSVVATTTEQGGLTVGPSGAGLWGIALDNSGSAYVVASTIPALYYVPRTSTAGTAITSSVTANTISSIPSATTAPSSASVNGGVTGGYLTPSNVAVDGAGNVFVANVGFASVVEYSPTLSAYVSPYFGFSPSVTGVASTASVTKFAVASGVITVTAPNSFVPGETVTLSGFTGNSAGLNGTVLTVIPTGLSGSKFEAAYSGAVAGATATGTATGTAYSQSTFNCVTISSATTCSPGPSAIQISNTGIAIDRAGSIWTVDGKGTLLEIVGTAAPTDPVLADGKYGVTP